MKKLKTPITMTLEKTDTGFSAYANDYPIFTTGRTIPELMQNAFEAASLYFEEEGFDLTLKNLHYEINFQQFFQYYKVINAGFLAEKIGMNPTLLSQYVKGHKKPSKKQRDKILKGLHEIGQELAEISLIDQKD